MAARVFLDWSKPTTRTVADWLRARGGHPLVLVPTRQAGRRLRAAFPGPATILTPAEFLDPAAPPPPAASLLPLTADLAHPRAARLTALFPAGVPARDFAERLALARSLLALRAELAENALTPAEAAARFPAGTAEAARWSDLARLLQRATASDAAAARLAFAASPQRPETCDHVVVAAVPDLQPLVLRALENLAVPVTILVPGPEDESAFDAWGRPEPAFWADRDPGWADFAREVQIAARPDPLELPPLPAETLEIGLLDRTLLPALRDAYPAHALHDPTGQPLHDHWLIRTLGTVAATATDATFDQAVDLLRHGALRAWLGPMDLDAALAEADAIQAKHFPATLRAARAWMAEAAPLAVATAKLEITFATLRGNPLPALGELAAQLADALRPSLAARDAADLATVLAGLRAALDALAPLAEDFPRLSAAEWMRTLHESLASPRLYPERPAPAIEASGWLELPWSESPHLLLAGANLGRLPVPLAGEFLLPERARETLGLPTTAHRQARDAYLLARLLAARAPGAVVALVLQLDTESSPLQPSPLLFAGAGDTLPARVDRLFAEPRPPHPDPAWHPGWLFDPPVIEMPRRISVTDFSRYLDCPFTFYLGRVVKMDRHAPAADELDAAQFGDLLHYALENWARDETAVHAREPAPIAAALDAHVDRWVRRELGRNLPLPLQIQVESARRRLLAFAEWQARDAAAGWRVEGVELRFEDLLGHPWEIDGWTIAGRIDRIDRNETDGRRRVIDYKTFDNPDDPAKKHRRGFRLERDWPPDYARSGEPPRLWTNLQLPLYRQLLIESGADPALLHVGYFNLPKTIAETGLQLWDELDDTLAASALTCARGVLADLARRRFWPPNPRADHADFADLFPPEPTRVIQPDGAFLRSCAP